MRLGQGVVGMATVAVVTVAVRSDAALETRKGPGNSVGCNLVGGALNTKKLCYLSLP